MTSKCAALCAISFIR